jgi:hypothetical protein
MDWPSKFTLKAKKGFGVFGQSSDATGTVGLLTQSVYPQLFFFLFLVLGIELRPLHLYHLIHIPSSFAFSFFSREGLMFFPRPDLTKILLPLPPE